VGIGVFYAVRADTVGSLPRLYNDYKLPLQESHEAAVKGVEAGVRRPPAREQRNVHCWKTLLSSAVRAVTENTSLCHSNL
jgi:hypothetical protein